MIDDKRIQELVVGCWYEIDRETHQKGNPNVDTDDLRIAHAIRKALAEDRGSRLPPDMALLERCREICMRVSFEAEEAAKAKDATDYVAGYKDACVDIDEEIRELMKPGGTS